MAKSVADVMSMVKDNDVKFVDFRFTDTRGKWQHITIPVSQFEEDKFEQGQAFDGSSIAGWKGIEASDMLLMPDAGTAFIDPFVEEVTLVLVCDVIEPTDGKAYERDPRSIAKRAETYLKQSGLGDTAFFGPEPEFFIFDSVEWKTDMSGTFRDINGPTTVACARLAVQEFGQRGFNVETVVADHQNRHAHSRGNRAQQNARGDQQSQAAGNYSVGSLKLVPKPQAFLHLPLFAGGKCGVIGGYLRRCRCFVPAEVSLD